MEGGKSLTQEEFNEYLRKLNPQDGCQFLVIIGIGLCNQDNFICPYKSKEAFTTAKGPMRECRREKILRYKKILGVKNQVI